MNMSPHSWRRISEWLDIALEKTATERDVWLKELTATLPPDEQSLLEPFKKLLAQQAHIETNDILRTPPDLSSALATQLKSPDNAVDLCAGAEIGGYRLIRELGSGGMGTVWFADRVDGKLKRSVALKFPYAGPLQRQVAKRFLQERDILASLEHPNIARLYDADVDNPDRPFLVLEYVDGVPIDEYCDAHGLSLRQRLELFRQVFSAVQYAHTRLVIHRDLKPSNILVTPDGVVRLLDFGIAKVLAPDGEPDPSLTEVGFRVLTPNFASPEQIAGAELTTASDVYVLGVVLYQLLTGARPYRLRREGRAYLEDAVASADIIDPSAAAAARNAVGAAQIARQLRGDLDTILLKALKRQPEDRYPTVAAFADDVDCYLRGEPVMARADSAWYRLRKLAGRNRLAVAATLAVIASLGIGLSVALWQLHTARVAQKRAEDVKEFTASIFRSADPFFTGNHSMSAADLLALARRRIDTELQAQPENAMELLNIVGESQVNLEQYAAARTTLERAISLSNDSLPADDLLLAQARARLAQVSIEDDDIDRAKALLAQSIPVLRAAGVKGARVLSDALQFQAYIDASEGKSSLAVTEAHEAYRAVLAALGPHDSETILSKRHWAQQLTSAGRYDEALPLVEQALHESESVQAIGERNALMEETEGLYGRLLVETGRLQQGITHLNKAIDISTNIYGAKSTANAVWLSNLMVAQMRLGDFNGMIATATKSLQASVDERATARPLTNLGRRYLQARKLPEAATYLRKAVAAEKKYDSGKGSWLPIAQAEYARTLLQLGRIAEARAVLRQTLPMVADSKGMQSIPYWNAAGLAEGMTGHWAESEQAYRHMLERTNESALQAQYRAEALSGVGIAELEQGRPQAAEASFRKAEQAMRTAYARMTPPHADVLVNLTRTLLQENRAAEAQPLIEAAENFWRDYDAASDWAGEAAYWHGQVLVATGHRVEARAAFTRAAKILETSHIASRVKLAANARRATRG